MQGFILCAFKAGFSPYTLFLPSLAILLELGFVYTFTSRYIFILEIFSLLLNADPVF